MSAPPVALSIAFRRGWQWPFRDGDTLRVYREGDRALLAELPAAFVQALVVHALTGQALAARWADYLAPLAPPEPQPGPPTPAPRLPAATGRRLRGLA